MSDGSVRRVYAKLESENPTGSVKDRTAYGLVHALASAGKVRAGCRLVDSTSGNFGVAVAYLARELDLPFVAVVDPKVTEENLLRLTELGATIETVDDEDVTGGYLLTRLARVHELLTGTVGDEYVWTNQYSNPANPRIHYQTLGDELVRELGGRVQVLLASVSTGGTLAGVSRRFREAAPDVQLVAVDARGSVALGGRSGSRLLTGIGASRRSDFLSPEQIDGVMYIDDAEAFRACHRARSDVGIWLGGSGGAVLAAAIRYFEANPDCTDAAIVVPDRGRNYEKTIYSLDWLAANSINIEQTNDMEYELIQNLGPLFATGFVDNRGTTRAPRTPASEVEAS